MRTIPDKVAEVQISLGSNRYLHVIATTSGELLTQQTVKTRLTKSKIPPLAPGFIDEAHLIELAQKEWPGRHIKLVKK
jgi:hypothetical protein